MGYILNCILCQGCLDTYTHMQIRMCIYTGQRGSKFTVFWFLKNYRKRHITINSSQNIPLCFKYTYPIILCKHTHAHTCTVKMLLHGLLGAVCYAVDNRMRLLELPWAWRLGTSLLASESRRISPLQGKPWGQTCDLSFHASLFVTEKPLEMGWASDHI